MMPPAADVAPERATIPAEKAIIPTPAASNPRPNKATAPAINSKPSETGPSIKAAVCRESMMPAKPTIALRIVLRSIDPRIFMATAMTVIAPANAIMPTAALLRSFVGMLFMATTMAAVTIRNAPSPLAKEFQSILEKALMGISKRVRAAANEIIAALTPIKLSDPPPNLPIRVIAPDIAARAIATPPIPLARLWIFILPRDFIGTTIRFKANAIAMIEAADFSQPPP